MTSPDFAPAPAPAGLTERLERLERSDRRMQAAVFGLTVLLVFVGFLLPLLRQDVAAKTFVLRSGGHTQALLTVTPSGAPALSFFDQQDNVRADLSLREDGSPGLVLLDEHGRVRGMFRLTPEGVPHIVFTDPEGRPRAAMGLPTDGLPALVLLGDSGRVRYMTP